MKTNIVFFIKEYHLSLIKLFTINLYHCICIPTKKTNFYYLPNKILMSEQKDIFIVDDSNTNIVHIEAILETKGYSSRTALSVKSAIPQIKKNKPALILLDLLMPHKSGFDFMEEIKDDPELNGIPVIIISALTDNLSKSKTKEMGAVEYLTKPLDIFALIAAVEKALG